MGQRVTFKELPVTIQTMVVGESVVVGARFNWKDGIDYRLGYGTDMDGNGIPDSPEILMTCHGVSAGKCTTWTVAPEPEGDGMAALFRVEQVPGKGGKMVPVNVHVGDYLMPFVQTLTVK